jgi:hypothetical protein
MRRYTHEEWLRAWQTRTLGLDELLAKDYRAQVRAELAACDELLRRMPLVKEWPVGQRACDNEGEVDF